MASSFPSNRPSRISRTRHKSTVVPCTRQKAHHSYLLGGNSSRCRFHISCYVIPRTGLPCAAIKLLPSDGCGFCLTDDDMAEMAAALPNLVDASFGYVCTANSCRTTVSSLLFLSTRCKNLEYLEVHFNTRNLRDELKSMPENPRLRDLYTLSRCRLVQLSVSYAPLRIDVEDYGAVLAGFLRIFPSLRELFGEALSWGELDSKLCNKE